MKILVVDDDVDFADGMAEMLELFGHELRTAYSCGEGIAMAEKEPVDLAFIDVGLDDRSGTECARGIQKSNSGAVCVLTTGYSADALTRMGISTNDFTVLRKPIKTEDLDPYLTDAGSMPGGPA